MSGSHIRHRPVWQVTLLSWLHQCSCMTMTSSSLDSEKAEETEAEWTTRLCSQISRNRDAQADEAKLVSHFYPRITYIVGRMVADPSAVEDIVQETFIAAIQSIREGKVQEPGKLGSFLHGIAKNKFREFARGEGPTQTDNELLVTVKTSAPEPEELIEAGQRSKHLRDLIANSEVDRDREVLLRHCIYQQDKATICNALHLDNKHFDKILHRAKQRLLNMAKHNAPNAEGQR